MVRVLIVGAGVTGSLCAFLVRKHLPTRLQCQIVVWEKSKGCGGRMATSRHPTNPQCIAELGAQYITRDPKYQESHASFYDELLQSEILKPSSGNIEGFRGDNLNNFICTNGLSTISKHFLSKSATDVLHSQRLDALRLTSDDPAEWSVWEAVTNKGGHDHFDAVIVTSPVQQILAIDGLESYLGPGQIEDLQSVKYSSRFAVGLFYKPRNYSIDLPFIAKYISDNDVVRYISIDHAKRGVKSDVGASVVAHTSVQFGLRHLEEDKEAVGPIVLEEVRRILPQLLEPDYVKHHKWRYSQVQNPAKTYGCMVVKRRPLLVLSGDGFTHSNFDGCVESALQVEREVLNWLGERSNVKS